MKQKTYPKVAAACALVTLAALASNANAAVSSTLPNWSKAGYKDGLALPTSGTVINLTTQGITANDGIDDSVKLQTVIDNIRSGTLKVNGAVVSDTNRAILLFPAGQIDLNKQIRVDASYITIRGAGNDPTTGTKIVFKPAATYSEDPANPGAPLIDGKLWPGYAAFRVEDRTKSTGDTTYEGSINFHWLSGVKVASGGGGTKGGNKVTVASGQGSKFVAGDTVYVGAANTAAFYDQMQAPQAYRYNGHMRTQMFKVVSVAGDVVTIDKPLEFDVPFSNGTTLPTDPGGTSNSIYYSKLMKVTAVKGVGFENFYFTQDISYTPYNGLINANDYDATTNPKGVGLMYKNAALQYALHGILFKWAQDGWVKGVRTYMTGSHPIVTEFAKNMEFRDNIIFGAWNKGKGGHGYFRNSKLYDSKIINNKVDRARHVTLQWSASGNVIQSNNITVDMNLHGGWERRNLIENNTVAVPFEHSSWGEGEGGADVLEGTWFPIWYGAGPHASKWSGGTGEQNVFFNNTMTKQKTKGGAYMPFDPYNNHNTIYQFAWDGAVWTHLQKPTGTFIPTWGGNEEVYYNQAPNKGVYACLQYAGTSLLETGTATNGCSGGSSSAASSAAASSVAASSAASSKASSSAAASSAAASSAAASSSNSSVSGPVTLTAAEDSYVYESNATTNFGTDTSMYVKNDAGKVRLSYVKFNLTGVTTVTSAKLRIYGSSTANTNLGAAQTTDGWTQAAITWNTKPAAGTAIGSVAMTTTAKYYEIDVTAYVQSQAGGDHVASFVLSETAGKYTTLNTKENAANKPQLVIQ
ncbi:MAG: hypothetical protein JWL63_3455 [Rhodocyclales bacterium]|nr:hypothetical protein [Rhodocyclales bacterium]